jgi:hypothetical protein
VKPKKLTLQQQMMAEAMEAREQQGQGTGQPQREKLTASANSTSVNIRNIVKQKPAAEDDVGVENASASVPNTVFNTNLIKEVVEQPAAKPVASSSAATAASVEDVVHKFAALDTID